MTVANEYSVDLYNQAVRTTAVSFVDFDGDNLADILVGNYGRNSVTVWEYNPGTGKFETEYTLSGFAGNIHAAELADVNEDGSPDFIVGTRGGTLQVGLSTAPHYPKAIIDGSYSWDVIAEDFDGDGHIDLFHGIDRHFSNVWYGNGNGGFVQGPEPAQVVGGSRGLGFTAVDLNQDGKLDLIGLQTAGNTAKLTAYLNQSMPGAPAWSGNIAGGVPGIGFSEPAAAPAAGDVNGDGLVDVAAVDIDRGPAPDQTTLRLFQGKKLASGALDWDVKTIDTVDGILYGPIVADLNGDGFDDILSGSSNFPDSVNGVYIYLSDGEGAYARQVVDFGLKTSNLNGIAVGDANGDGIADILTSTWIGAPGGGFAVLTGESGCDRTINGSGRADRLKGGKQDDCINAYNGNDKVQAFQGDDVVYAGAGHDTVFGQKGDDSLFGQAGNDFLKGDDGDDIAYGGPGNDRIDGGDGNDLIVGGTGNDRVTGNDGNDLVFAKAGADQIRFGGQGSDTAVGGSGNDRFYWSQIEDNADGSWDHIIGDQHLQLRLITETGFETKQNAFNTSRGFDRADITVTDAATATALEAEIRAEYNGETTASLQSVKLTIAEIDLINIFIPGQNNPVATLDSDDFF